MWMKYQVYGHEDELYYHVGSPRMRLKAEPYRGKIFDTYDECLAECTKLKQADPQRLWSLLPRALDEHGNDL